MKLYLCPNNALKCYTTSPNQDYDQIKPSKIVQVNDMARQLGGTTLDFGQNDICSWHLQGTSQYPNNKILRVTINSLVSSSCYLNSGDNILSASTETSCSKGTTYDFDADTNVYLIAQGSAQGANLQFSYQLIDKFDITAVSTTYSVSLFVFVLLTAAVLVLTMRFCMHKTIIQNQEYWKKMSSEMKKEVEDTVKEIEQKKNLTVEDLDDVRTNYPMMQHHNDQVRRQQQSQYYKVAPDTMNYQAKDVQYQNRRQQDQPTFNLY